MSLAEFGHELPLISVQSLQARRCGLKFLRYRVGALGIAFFIHCSIMVLFLSPGKRSVNVPKKPRSFLLLLSTEPKAGGHTFRGAPASTLRRPHRIVAPLTVIAGEAPTPTTPPEIAAPDTFAIDPLPSAYDIMQNARRDLHQIDKEILGSLKAVPGERADGRHMRLARGIANAFVGNTSEITHHYTAPDGVIYTRITKGSRQKCYMSGAAGYAAATRSGGSWRPVNCPPDDSGWVR
jgi:hypothetical protein